MAEPLRHRQTKGAETDMFSLTATAPHSDSTKALVWALSCQVVLFKSCHGASILVFESVAIISWSRPNCFCSPLRAATVKGGRRPSRSDLPLTVTSTAADLLNREDRLNEQRAGFYDDTEGSSPSGANFAPQTCIRLIREDRSHDAVVRIGGEAPRRRAHS